MAAVVAPPVPLCEPQPDKLYFLPRASEDLERDRLDVQHEAITRAMGGLCPDMEVVKRVLDPRKGNLAVLDVGSGSGAWAMGMARLFPHAQVLGIDLVPNIPSNPPPNCRFEVGDLNSGLIQYTARFDVIHARGLGRGIEDFPTAYQSLVRLLRPGGVIFVAESQLRVYGVDKEPAPVWLDSDEYDASPTKTPRSALSRLLHELGKVVDRMGKIPNASTEVSPQLHLHLRDALSVANHSPSPISTKQQFLQVGWAGLPEDTPGPGDGRVVGELMRANVNSFMPATRALLLGGGAAPDRVERWIQKTVGEIQGGSQVYCCWFYSWGFRT